MLLLHHVVKISSRANPQVVFLIHPVRGLIFLTLYVEFDEGQKDYSISRGWATRLQMNLPTSAHIRMMQGWERSEHSCMGQNGVALIPTHTSLQKCFALQVVCQQHTND